VLLPQPKRNNSGLPAAEQLKKSRYFRKVTAFSVELIPEFRAPDQNKWSVGSIEQ
jgi:hypothetical protein